MDFTRRAAISALLVLGLLATTSVFYFRSNDENTNSAATGPSPLLDDFGNNLVSNQTLEILSGRQPPSQPLLQHRRKLASVKPDISEEEQQKQMRAYLGGLYPPVDKDLMPLYLRDTLDTNERVVLDMYNPSGQAMARNRDIVFFWHIPKASGSTMKNILNFCFGLTRAEKVTEPASMEFVRERVLNMDTSSPDGLSFSFASQLVNSNRVDVIVSNYFLSGSALFTDAHLGKSFTILRHPVDIALSLFHYRKKATWERSFRKDWQNSSFTNYVNSSYYMDSWMVRQLTGTMPWVELNEVHLERAKTMMKKKIFVGIVEQMDETVRQLKAHFGWKEKTPSCAFENLHNKAANKNSHPGVEGGRGGTVWNLVVEKEKWDLSLYHYGLELFAEQRARYPPLDGHES